MLMTCRRYYRGKQAIHKVHRNRRRVFFIPKTLFAEDLVHIYTADDPDYELWYVSREPLIRISSAFLPEELSQYNYCSDSEEANIAKDELRSHWRKTLRIFSNVVKPAAFLTCAYNYLEQREFAAASVANRIPFIALNKECITTPITRAARANVYGSLSGPFTGSFITTYNEDERETLVISGCIRPDQVEVVGCPRMDPLFQDCPPNSRRAVYDIVFFSFSCHTYLPHFKGIPHWPKQIGALAIEPWDWSDLYMRFHCYVDKFARSHPTLRIALKVKTGFNIEDTLLKDSVGNSALPPNLELLTSGEGGTLAAGARVVCGFNSTVLLEALAARTPVVCPAFGEADSGTVAGKLGTLSLGSTVFYAADEEDLTRRLEALAITTPDRSRALNYDEQVTLSKYIGFLDGRSGARARTSVARAMSVFG